MGLMVQAGLYVFSILYIILYYIILFYITSCSPTNSLLLKKYQSFFSLPSPYLWNQLPHSLRQPRLDLPLPDSSLLQDHLTSHPSPHHSSFRNSKLSYFSIDIWHLFGLISRISGLLYGFFLRFSFCTSFSCRYFLPF